MTATIAELDSYLDAAARVDAIREAGRLHLTTDPASLGLTCLTCRQRPATHAGECADCFSLSIDLDGRYGDE